MPRKIAASTLNASTLDIMNVIRQNASYEYQSKVPTVETYADIPKVGDVIYGTPAFANQFINALVNRIAFVQMQSSVFNNPYRILKKGYIEFGETIEDIFVGIIKAIDYNPEKAEARELKRYMPDVKSAFHTMNWRVIYPVTIQDEDLKMAFLSVEGVRDLIANIVEQVYTGAEYDEFLLMKYLLIKAVSHGKLHPISAGTDTNLNQAATVFRGTSNLLNFMSNSYNEAGVKTNTPRRRQVIFMDSMFNAQFDVEVLAGAFNMDKADFVGRLFLVDEWDTFDNERFETIRAASDGLEEITAAELALMRNVRAIVLDKNWFQVYDNLNKMTEKYVANGLYWNYFYHTWKTVSYSPFANAVVFVSADATTTLPASITVELTSKSISEDAVVFTLEAQDDNASLEPSTIQFVQTEALTEAGIAVQKYGALIIPQSQVATEITLVATIGGKTYTAATTITSASDVGETLVLS